jgi:hypothetical protein
MTNRLDLGDGFYITHANFGGDYVHFTLHSPANVMLDRTLIKLSKGNKYTRAAKWGCAVKKDYLKARGTGCT